MNDMPHTDPRPFEERYSHDISLDEVSDANRRKTMNNNTEGVAANSVPTNDPKEIERRIDALAESASLAKTPVEENTWYKTTGEVTRTYVFPHGEYTIFNPEKVLIKRKPEGDSHRVISRDEDGTPHSHYIPCGWIAISWKGVDKTEVFGW